MIRLVLIITIFLLPAYQLEAQRLINTGSIRTINADNYFRIQYENDYFTATDYYYTQGIQIELVSPALGKLLPRLRLGPRFSSMQYGLAIEHFGFTTTDIRISEIMAGDQPYAGCLRVRSFRMATDSMSGLQLTTGISAGIIGPGAGGGEMQAGIHRLTDNAEPKGWHNQVRNDVILNVEFQLEKSLLRSKNFYASTISRADAGTQLTQLQSGISFKAGRLKISQNGFTCYATAQLTGIVVGYDATLQGGLFNRTSAYVIPPGDITRLLAHVNYGFTLIYRKLFLEYHQSCITRRFEGGRPHAWGGVSVGIVI